MSPRLPLACLTLIALAGCTEGRSPITPKTFDAAIPDAGPDAERLDQSAMRRHPTAAFNVIPPPPAEPARPEGEPRDAEDLRRLSTAAERGEPVQQPGAPPIKRLDAYRLRVGAVLVDRLARRLEIPTRVNMQEGILEYVAVGTHGKLHESVLEVLAEPSHIHLGLLLIGLEPRQYSKPADPYEVPKLLREGGRMALSMQWTDPKSGEVKTGAPAVWLYDRQIKAAPQPQAWYFEGSQFWNGRYVADNERSVISLIPDRNAVIAIGDDAGNPYRGDAQGYEVYTGEIPPNGTPVKLSIAAFGYEPPKVEPGKKPDIPGAPATPPPAPPTPPAAPAPPAP